MKFIILLCVILLVQFGFSQDKNFQKETKKPETFEYKEGDSTFVMQKYFLMIYKKGANRNQSKEEAGKLQKEHLTHLGEIAKANKASIIGPFDAKPEDEWRGIVIYNTATLEEAKELTKKDPMVQTQRLTYETKGVWLAKGSKLP